MQIPTLDDLLTARDRIDGIVRRTPILTCSALDRMAGARLVLKVESFQTTGSFKFRGATNAVRSLDDGEARRGVATHSSGNHAQALARAARDRGAPAFIVMPETSPAVKRAAVEAYGGRITFCAPTLAAREQTLRSVVEETGATVVHPYDDARIVAGQSTAAAELMDEVADLDLIVAPVGGGGLLSGTVLAAHYRRGGGPRIVGAEPELADDAHRSLRAGRRLPPCPPRSVADGLLTALGELNFAILRQAGVDIVLVSDEEILEAMRLVWERAKLIVEPSGAVSVAAVLSGRLDVAGRSVGLILSGGNVDLCRNDRCRYWK